MIDSACRNADSNSSTLAGVTDRSACSKIIGTVCAATSGNRMHRRGFRRTIERRRTAILPEVG
ncbi:hypothetical protein OPAG_09170 [Rhodococcus opacus PD630]|nr:hypothetical protein OPAG_09170 [Rhodococcus opacus PD630]